MRRQCELLGLGRANWSDPPAEARADTVVLMRAIDQQYTQTPFYGSRRMTGYLDGRGYVVNRKRVQRLMRIMGVAGVAPGPHTSRPHPTHALYPYLLRDVVVERPNQVWCTDVTYSPMPRGFMFLVAILDWYRRAVLAWVVSNTQDTTFCLQALEQAFRQGCPEIVNSDQGCQCTSAAFTTMVEPAGVRSSMDGRGRVCDNIFIERLWRTVKYEHISLQDYRSGWDLERGLTTEFHCYNTARPPQALGDRTPEQVHFEYPGDTGYYVYARSQSLLIFLMQWP